MDGSGYAWLIRVGVATFLLAAAGILADPAPDPVDGPVGDALTKTDLAQA